MGKGLREIWEKVGPFDKNREKVATNPFNPLTSGKGEISLLHHQAIFSKLNNEDKDLFSFRNCKK